MFWLPRAVFLDTLADRLRVIAGLLHGIQPTDALTFAGVAVALGVLAVVASLVPARRAASVDPVLALRSE